MKTIMLSIILCVFTSLAVAQEVGERANVNAWCFDKESAVRLGEASLNGVEAHVAFLQAQGNTCVVSAPQRFNVTVIEKSFRIGRLQFWLVLPDGATGPVYVWTIMPKSIPV